MRHQLVVSATESPFSEPPSVAFGREFDTCPECGARVYVQKTNTRQVTTLHVGTFIARETVMICRPCNAGSLHSAKLAELVPKGCNFGYDVMVVAGRSLFLDHRTAEETAAILAAQNVHVSESEVRELAARFIAYLGIAHLQVRCRRDLAQ